MVNTQDVVTIEIEPGSELARALAAAGEKPVRLVSNGHRYVVSSDQDDVWVGYDNLDSEREISDDDLWANYDPERVRAAVRAAAGSLTEEEGERLKALIYEGREEGTRPIDRP